MPESNDSNADEYFNKRTIPNVQYNFHIRNVRIEICDV